MKKLLLFISIFLFGITFAGCSLNSIAITSETTIGTTGSTTVETTSTTTEATTTAISTFTTEATTSAVSTQITTQEQTTASTTTAATTLPTTAVTTLPTTVTSTTPPTTVERYQTIRLFSMNDFHGGTYSDIENLEQIGSYMKYQKQTYENTIILAAGDIFQGAALSNYYYGEPIVEAYNNIGFDGFVLGNHEFDWGIDKILKYRDGIKTEDNAEMSYPILAANIVYIDSGEPLENTIPYIIKEFNGIKVGVIGIIGNVIDSISASRVQNIEFLDPTDTVYDYALELRSNQDCDIVVVYAHSGSSINHEIATFTGDHYVDAVFNGHTHQSEASTISRAVGESLVYAQSSNSDSSLFSKITLVYDTQIDEVITVSAANISWSEIQYEVDTEIESLLDEFQNDSVYTAFVSQELTEVSNYYNRSDLSTWGASVVRDYAQVDVGAINSGGFRSTMPSGMLTMGNMIEIYPFDNYIKTSRLTGRQLLDFYENIIDYGDDVVFDDGLTYNGSNLYIDGVLVQATTLYTIGAVDYIFDKDYYAFLDGQDITQTVLLMRDLLVEDLLATDGSFNPYNGTSFQDLSVIYDPNFFRDLRRRISI